MTLAIPITGLLVLVIFYFVGIPLNQMSVMAVIMAFGLLVDDAVVVTEQLHRRVTGEETPVVISQDDAALSDVQRAAAEEPAKLTAPLVVSTLTTIAAFVPIYLLPGGTGEFVLEQVDGRTTEGRHRCNPSMRGMRMSVCAGPGCWCREEDR